MFEKGSSFSDVLNFEVVHKLSQRIKKNYPNFNTDAFLSSINLKPLKFAGRVRHIADALELHLAANFKKNCEILVRSLPPEIPEERAGETFAAHFIVLPMTEYVARNGQQPQHLKIALDTLKIMTKSFSSESAIRPFLIHREKEAISYLIKMTKDKNAHVRRWASEGSRPRLPQSVPLKKFIGDPKPILPILEALKNDPHLYVRRSVANSFNDIAKDHPDLVVKVFKTWQKGASQETQWIIKHGLRTLLKRGHPGALKLQGLTSSDLTVNKLKVTQEITIGDELQFSLEILNSGEPGRVMVDYVIEFKKKKGTSEKVFKLKTITLGQNEKIKLEGRRLLDHFTTRKMYPGEHTLIIQANGIRLGKKTFWVK